MEELVDLETEEMVDPEMEDIMEVELLHEACLTPVSLYELCGFLFKDEAIPDEVLQHCCCCSGWLSSC